MRVVKVTEDQKKVRAAAYCRVSTLLDSQETSIASQQMHYERLIKENSDWEFAGIYLEAGVSGTKTEKRPELQRLIADCQAGRIDLVLTKSISRFSRSTSDCLEMVRTLTSLGVTVVFEKEQIRTDSMESEFMLSILACFAESESRSISENMKWGIRKRFENGTYRQSIPPYGYEWRNGKLAIVPEQAEVVKKIFSMVLSGNGCVGIARELNRQMIPGPTGKGWSQGTVQAMIANPAYMGHALYQKTYMDESFRQRKNKGELDQYYEEAHHEGIISREDFVNARKAQRQRAEEVGYGDKAECRSGNRYCFTGILFCENCGAVMHRQPGPKGNVSWVCGRHARQPELCRMKPQSDDDLKCAFVNCLNKLAWSQGSRESGSRILDIYLDMIGGKHTEPIVRMGEGQEETCREGRKLRDFVGGWSLTDESAMFPEKTFTELVKRCVVQSKKQVVFHFHCGLRLTESLCNNILEAE